MEGRDAAARNLKRARNIFNRESARLERELKKTDEDVQIELTEHANQCAEEEARVEREGRAVIDRKRAEV